MPRLALTPFQPPDIDRLISWVPDAAMLLQWAGPSLSWPLTASQLERDIRAAGPGTAQLMYRAATSDGDIVGHIEIKAIDRRHANAMLGRILIAPAHRGKGLALPLVNAALEICFNDLKLHRVGLRVFAHNTGAIEIYKRCGFAVEGHERHTKRAPDGTWWDACTMAILEDEWRTRTPAT